MELPLTNTLSACSQCSASLDYLQNKRTTQKNKYIALWSLLNNKVIKHHKQQQSLYTLRKWKEVILRGRNKLHLLTNCQKLVYCKGQILKSFLHFTCEIDYLKDTHLNTYVAPLTSSTDIVKKASFKIKIKEGQRRGFLIFADYATIHFLTVNESTFSWATKKTIAQLFLRIPIMELIENFPHIMFSELLSDHFIIWSLSTDSPGSSYAC